MFYDLTIKKNFQKGMLVEISTNTDEIIRGYILEVNSKSNNEKGIIVTLQNGRKGRVVSVPSINEVKKENFKFYNLFFHNKEIYSIYVKKTKSCLTLPIYNKTLNIDEVTIFMFTSKEEALGAIEFFKLDKKQYIINKIDTRKTYLKSFSSLSYEVIRIDIKRKLTTELFLEYEEKFKSF